jgi:GDP-L-fucose synthase
MKKILLTGGYGFLGSVLYQKLGLNYDVIRFRSSEFDLRKESDTIKLFSKVRPDIVVNAAARLGGIGDNQAHPADYFRDNMLIGMNVFRQSQIFEVQKVIQIGTVCSYPKLIPTPFTEEDLWNGFPEGTNSAYGISKRALISYAEAIYKQFGTEIVTVLLANLYGAGDDFRDETSHVIPAVIKKVDNALATNSNEVSIWGDGTPTRDLLYVDDAAEGISAVIQSDVQVGAYNIATGVETSIKDLVELIAKKMGFEGELIFDSSKPNGQPKRLLNISKILADTDWKPETILQKGIEDTIEYYRQNRDNISSLERKYK